MTDIRVISDQGSDVNEAEVVIYDSLEAWKSDTGSIITEITNEEGIATIELNDGQQYWADVIVSDVENNWGQQITFRAEDGVEAELKTKVEPLAALINRTWFVETAEADTTGSPSQELLDCWVGTQIKFTKSSGRKGPLSMTAASGCTLIDLSFYNEWSDNPSGGSMTLNRSDDGYPISFRPSYGDRKITASFAYDLDGDGIGDADSLTKVTLREE